MTNLINSDKIWNNMKKEIVLYEAFAGIGAQWKALKNLLEKLNIKVTNIGSCEWYIDAIISYISIHYGIFLNSEINFSKQEMVNKLKNMLFSSEWLFYIFIRKWKYNLK